MQQSKKELPSSTYKVCMDCLESRIKESIPNLKEGDTVKVVPFLECENTLSIVSLGTVKSVKSTNATD